MIAYGRAFTVGDIFSETFAILMANWRIILAYAAVVALVASGLAAVAGTVGMEPNPVYGRGVGVTLPVMIVSSITGYFVSWQLLENLGLATVSRSAGLFFLNLLAGFVMGIGVGIGVILLVVPGLILMARWSVATSLIVGRGAGFTEALGDSWAMTKSRQWTIIGFYCLFFLIFFGLLTPLSAGISAAGLTAGEGTAAGFIVGFLKGLFQYFLSGIGFCASAALFALVLEYSGSEEEVFA